MQFRRGDVVYVHHSRKHYKPEGWSPWDGPGIVKDSTEFPSGEIIVIVYPMFCDYGSGGFNPDALELLGHIELEEGEKQNANRR